MTKKRDKLSKVWVPESFYLRFLSNIPRGTSSVVDKLHDQAPQARGRGTSRAIVDLTEAEWEELYEYAADARASMKKANTAGDTSHHRDDTLGPAICGQTLANRMELLGVKNPRAYSPKKTSRRTKVEIEASRRAEETTATQSSLPLDPPTVAKVNVPEATPDEQAAFQRDMALGK